MTKRLLAITISMLLIISVFPVIALGTSVTLALSQDSAMVETSITASGIADPDEWVSIKVVDSSGDIVFFDAVKSNTSGNYSCTFKVPQVSPGILTVVAGYGSNVATKPLTVSAIDTKIPVSGISLNKNSLTLQVDKSQTLVATVVPANASNKAINWSSNKEAVAIVDEDGKVTGVGPGTATITVITVDGQKTANCTVTVTKPVTVSDGGTVNIEADTPVTITVPPGVTSNIAVTQNVALPLVEVNSNQVDMTIPEGTMVIGASTIRLPEIKPSSSVNVAADKKVNLVIAIGSDEGTITFNNKPVRIVLKGQVGKLAAFIDNNGTFHPISKLESLNGLISDSDADAAKVALASARVEEGAFDFGSDLIIWTTHFTKFIAYTQSTGRSSSSGGGYSAPIGQTITSTGGTVKEAGAETTFPANAVSSDIKVTVKKLTTGIPTVSSRFKLLGEVYEITSDKTSEFNKPVRITLPFDGSKIDTDKYDIGIYCWNNNQWVILDDVKVDTTAGKISGEVNHFGKFAALAGEKVIDYEKEPIEDVIAPVKPVLTDITGHWAEANISKLVAAEAVSGYPDGTFKPDNTISRAEFATILVKAFKLEAKEGKIFNDTANHWAKGYIATANANNIVSGYSDTNFGPDDIITREQMAVMIVKAAKLTNAAEGKTFTDATQISDWAKEAIGIASGEGIVSGYPDNTFKPKANATRAEAVTVIVKAL